MSPFNPFKESEGFMKNIFKYLMISLLLVFLHSYSFAYSEKFELMISTMGIEKQNINGKELNEEIYNAYSLFVYGSPQDGYNGQRFKSVEQGLSSNGNSVGEYWVLGENFEGYEVHNHKFPVDVEPPTSPETWRYALIKNAYDSWQDQSKYMDDLQREYMLNSLLARNDTAYQITVKDIGLNKVRLENYATWKTKGTVYTERYDIQNKRWAANFMVPPMAANSEIESYARFPNGTIYNAEEKQRVVSIPIKYGAYAKELTDYAKKEHVKEIKSQLFINDVLIGEIKDAEILEIESDLNYDVFKSSDNEIVVLNVSVKSTLLTKFTTDGALADVKNYVVIVNFGSEIIEEEKEIKTYNNYVRDEEKSTSEEVPPPLIKEVKVYRIVNGERRKLLTAITTNKAFICAGQTIVINVSVANSVDRTTISFAGDSSIFTFDDITKKIEWDEPRSRGKATFLNSLKDSQKMYAGALLMNVDSVDENITNFSYTYIIPYGTKQTLNSWSTLREESKNAFSINESKVFSRIRSPYQIVIKASGFGGITTKRFDLDVFERWDTLYNRDISKYVKKEY